MTPAASGVFDGDPALARITDDRVRTIEAAAERAGIDRDLALGVVYVESRFNPAATSQVGAMGLMQLMPATWGELARRLGLNAERPYDERANVTAGTAYLAALHRRWGSWCWAIPSYFAGAGGVAKHGPSKFASYTRAVAYQWHRFAVARGRAVRGPALAAKVPATWIDARCGTFAPSPSPSPSPSPRPRPSPRPSPRPVDTSAAGVILVIGLALAASQIVRGWW